MPKRKSVPVVVTKKDIDMRWRSLLFVVIWGLVILLLMFPDLCGQLSICGKSSLPLVILLGIAGAVVAISDKRLVKRKAREKFLGHSQESDNNHSS